MREVVSAQQLVEDAAILRSILGQECSDLVASAFSTNLLNSSFKRDLMHLCERHKNEVEDILITFLSIELSAFSDENLRLIMSHIEFFRLVCPEMADHILKKAHRYH